MTDVEKIALYEAVLEEIAKIEPMNLYAYGDELSQLIDVVELAERTLIQVKSSWIS